MPTKPSSTSEFSKLLSAYAYDSGKDTKSSRISSSSSSPKRKREEDDAEQQNCKPPKTRKILDNLPPLQDRLMKNLDVVFCGCNPGHTSALVGFHYGNVHNGFWRCLHQSGFTESLLSPDQGPMLPERYSIGLVPDSLYCQGNFLISFADGPGINSQPQFRRYTCARTPRVLALNSFTIWADIASQLDKRNGLEGIALKGPSGHTRPPVRLPRLQENRKPHFIPWKIVYTDVDELETESVKETLIMPLPGTSGANASYSLNEKIAFFTAIHEALPLIKRGVFPTSHMGEIRIRLTGLDNHRRDEEEHKAHGTRECNHL